MTLVLYPDGKADEAVRVETAEFVVGRSPDADWRLDGNTLSRRHLVIRRLDGMYLVEDLSRNGTCLNGSRLAHGQPAVLRPGDRLRIDVLDIRVAEHMPQVAVPAADVDTSAIEALVAVDDPVHGWPEPLAEPTASPLDGRWPAGAPVRQHDIDLARRLFDALLCDLDPSRFERVDDRHVRFGRGRRDAWKRYRRHLLRIQVDPDAYFQRLIDGDGQARRIR